MINLGCLQMETDKMAQLFTAEVQNVVLLSGMEREKKEKIHLFIF